MILDYELTMTLRKIMIVLNCAYLFNLFPINSLKKFTVIPHSLFQYNVTLIVRLKTRAKWIIENDLY